MKERIDELTAMRKETISTLSLFYDNLENENDPLIVVAQMQDRINMLIDYIVKLERFVMDVVGDFAGKT